MRILVTNDDGVHSPGLHALARMLVRRGHTVTVAAPAGEQSAIGRALTMNRILRARPAAIPGFEGQVLAVEGTPTDCVKLAVLELLTERPEGVVSGVNIGTNLGGDVLYSGTVAAAMEAVYQRIPALAFSTASVRGGTPDFGPAEAALDWALELLSGRPLPPGVMLNINFPQTACRGYRVAPLGSLNYQEHYSRRTDPRGGDYYWLDGGPRVDPGDTRSDVYWFGQGYCTATPLSLDITDHEFLQKLGGGAAWRRDS